MNPYVDIHESVWTYMGFKTAPDRVSAFRTALDRIQAGQCTDAITGFPDLWLEVVQHWRMDRIYCYNIHDEFGSVLAVYEDQTQFHADPPDHETTCFDSRTGQIVAIIVCVRNSYVNIVPRFRTAMRRFLHRYHQRRDVGTEVLTKRGVLPPELVAKIISYV